MKPYKRQLVTCSDEDVPNHEDTTSGAAAGGASDGKFDIALPAQHLVRVVCTHDDCASVFAGP